MEGIVAASRKSVKGKREAQKQQMCKASSRRDAELTTDDHYIVIDGRRWRATDQRISEMERKLLVGELVKARRDVGRALREKGVETEREARVRVNQAKIALRERWTHVVGRYFGDRR